jgi:GT2 family glycosyltransferase
VRIREKGRAMSNIYYFTPYSLEKNLGKAYNDYMKLVPSSDDWVALVDADIMFLRPDFGHQIAEIVSKYPDAGMFTCYTNRVGNARQRYPGMWNVADMLKHRKVATDLQKNRRCNIQEILPPISGHLMVFRKSTWEMSGGFTEDKKILGVDNNFSNRVHSMGKKIYIMCGVYMLHYYRMAEGRAYKNHLL